MGNLHTQCLFCHSEKLHPLGGTYAHASLVKCASCRLVFAQGIPTAEELQAHYATYTRDNSISPLTVKRYEELLEQFEPYRKLNRILDIGCGDGHFLAVARQKGWEVYGTEFTTDAVAVCAAKGIHMHQGPLETFSSPEKFDVITSFEVLEHINNGNEHVLQVHSLLRPKGLFYFTTPNFNSLSRRWLGGKWNVIEYPEHLTYYTVNTLTKVLRAAGFQKEKFLSSGFSPQRFKISSGNETASGNSDETLRNAIEQKTLLRLVKKTINGLLNFFRAGDTLKGYFTRP